MGLKLKMKLLVVLTAVLIMQQLRACAPSCAGANTISQRGVVNKTIERVVVSGVEEAQWRGICHSFCITVSC